jgi:hypothetical protein
VQTKSLPFYEIVRYLAIHWNRIPTADAERLVELALHARLSHFEEAEMTGLWTIKHREQSDLDIVYRFMQQQYKVYSAVQLSKKVKWKNSREQFGQLASDIRFSSVQFDGEEYWMLSEWELANDLIYDYMRHNKISVLPLTEIFDVLATYYDLVRDKAVFAPEIDLRFRIKGETVAIELDTVAEINDNFEFDVPDEIKEEVARASLLICKLLDRIASASVKEIVTSIMGIKAFDKTFTLYCKAINELLELVKGYRLEENGIWRCISMKEDSLETVTFQSWKYAVYGSVPSKDIVPYTTSDVEEMNSDHARQKATIIPEGNSSVERILMHCLSYYERIKGYFKIPSGWDDLFTDVQGRSSIVCKGIEYLWSWKREKGRCYFYGGGVMDFYFDNVLEAGRELLLAWNNDNHRFDVEIGNINNLVASEQARYLDIGLLVEESKTVNKSFFVLMCEVMASYPSGIHWVKFV